MILFPMPGLASPIEWPASTGGNGHYYELVFKTSGDELLSWNQARTDAAAKSWQGVSGHLASLTSVSENDFVFQNVYEAPDSIDDMVWTGGFQDKSAPAYQEPAGGWSWVTGESFGGVTCWRTDEPNDSPGGEDYLAMRADGGWNDVRDTASSRLNEVRAYLVEYPIAPHEATGDTNGDGDIDLDDLNNVRNHFGRTGTDLLGDVDGNGSVTLVDLNLVRNNFGHIAGANPVPEPSSLVLLALSAVGVVVRRRTVRRTEWFGLTPSAGELANKLHRLLFTPRVMNNSPCRCEIRPGKARG